MASLRVEMMVVLTALRTAARSVEWKEWLLVVLTALRTVARSAEWKGFSLVGSRESMKVGQMV